MVASSDARGRAAGTSAFFGTIATATAAEATVREGLLSIGPHAPSTVVGCGVIDPAWTATLSPRGSPFELFTQRWPLLSGWQ